jgi:hypothetical protein
MHEEGPSFQNCCYKNDVHDVIGGDRQLTVYEIAGKCGILKVTVHEILSHDLNMSHLCSIGAENFDK